MLRGSLKFVSSFHLIVFKIKFNRFACVFQLCWRVFLCLTLLYYVLYRPQTIWCFLLELYLFALFLFLVLELVYLQSPSFSLVLGWFVIIFELSWWRDDIIFILLHHLFITLWWFWDWSYAFVVETGLSSAIMILGAGYTFCFKSNLTSCDLDNFLRTDLFISI